MSLFDGHDLPDTPSLRAVRLYLEAQQAKDFAKAAEFFAEDVVFHGLILKASGRAEVAQQMQGFISAAIDHIRLEALTEVEAEEEGRPARVLALYWFKLKPAEGEQILCDHLLVRGGRITRIENVFDVRKLPPM